MLLLVLYNVRSERELMDTLPERLDWLWFLGLTIESPIPDHSILSKARTRWGQDAFNEYGVQIMSPSYRGDPEAPKVVPKEQWYAAPAKTPHEP